jgi:hypothetical protein
MLEREISDGHRHSTENLGVSVFGCACAMIAEPLKNYYFIFSNQETQKDLPDHILGRTHIITKKSTIKLSVIFIDV